MVENEQATMDMLRSSADAISARLRRIKVRAIVPDASAMTRPWGLILETRQPGFFAVRSGRMWLRLGRGKDVELQAGEIAVALRPEGSIVACDPPGTPPVRPPDLLNPDEMRARKGLANGSGASTTSFYCGGLMEINGLIDDLLEQMPPLVVLRRSRHSELMFELLDGLTAKEYTRESQGDMVAGLIVMRAIEESIGPLTVQKPQALRAMADEAIGPVVQLIHDFPERGWNMERLSLEAGLSRSMFHERFVGVLGVPPMSFVRRVRLERARQLIESGGLGIREVARKVGYGSSSALSSAYRREFGRPPGKETRSGSATPG